MSIVDNIPTFATDQEVEKYERLTPDIKGALPVFHSVPTCDKCKSIIRTSMDIESIDVGNLNDVMYCQCQTTGKKNDSGKPMLGLVPRSLIWAVGHVLTFGAAVYGQHNWRKGLDWSRPYNALLRHLTAWWDGESLDKESGKSHLWHAAAELAFLIEYEESKTGTDDRFKK